MNEINEADDYPDRQHVAERARFHVTLGALRGALEEQPSANAVRSCGRRWLAAATQVIDEVAKTVNTKGGDR